MVSQKKGVGRPRLEKTEMVRTPVSLKPLFADIKEVYKSEPELLAELELFVRGVRERQEMANAI